MRPAAALAVAAGSVLTTACGAPVATAPPSSAPRVVAAAREQGRAPSDAPRLIPAEAYLKTYLTLFGGLTPAEVEVRARGREGLVAGHGPASGAPFDTWEDYWAALGFPEHRLDLPRAVQTNSLMLAAFEKLGIALCDRAIEHDLKSTPPVPVEKRLVFAFDAPDRSVTALEFAPRFDVLHRTFLSYPAGLSPGGRTAAFFALYEQTVARHAAPGAPPSRFTPSEAGWAAVCYGLSRHPEFHLY